MWNMFWDTAPYVGKARFNNPRNSYEDNNQWDDPEYTRQRTTRLRRHYEDKRYWDEVDLNDLHYTLLREDEDWEYGSSDTWNSEARNYQDEEEAEEEYEEVEEQTEQAMMAFQEPEPMLIN